MQALIEAWVYAALISVNPALHCWNSDKVCQTDKDIP